MKLNRTVRFVVGRAGSGKTQHILDRVDGILRAEPIGPPVFVIVPDQATLLYERMITCRHEKMATTRLRVLGFGQFGNYVLSCVGGAAVPEVTALGRQLLITRLLLESAGELSYYRQSVTQPGLPDVIDRLFSEFEETGKSLEDLDYLIADLEQAEPAATLSLKLKDLRLLYPRYRQALGSERLDQHLRDRQICQAIASCSELDEAYLAVDAFDDLRPSECRLLACCAARGMTMDVALTIDPRDKSATDPESKIEEGDPFRRTRRTFQRLSCCLREAGVKMTLEPLKTNPRFKSKSLAALEANFLDGRPAKVGIEDGVKFVEAPSKQAEIDHAARLIRDKIAEGTRYRDIAILVRSIREYGDAIESSFRAHKIPFFVDRVREATHHPLVQLALGLLRPSLATLRSSSVIDILKTELTHVDRPTLEQLELYVQTRGIEGNAWQLDSTWKLDQSEHEEEIRSDFGSTKLQQLDLARRSLLKQLDPWLKMMNESATVSQFVSTLYATITNLGAPEALARWIESADEETGNEHREVWTTLMEMLDQLVEVVGTESMRFEDFASLLRAGLAEFSFAIAPPTIDQVIVGSVDRTRLGSVKLVVVLGLADGIFPARHDSTTDLRDDERRALSARQWDIGPDSRMRLLDELLLAYQGFSLPRELLVVSRPQFDDTGRELPPSSLWWRLRAIFPDLKPADIDWNHVKSLGSFDQMIRALLLHARSTNGKLEPDFVGIYELIRTNPTLKQSAAQPISSLIYTNIATLTPEVIGELYGSKRIAGSVSRLETFASCPFKHFARYTLRLDEQTAPELTRMELGSAYHSALERLFLRIIRGEQSFDDDLRPVLSSLADSLAADLETRVAIDESRAQFVKAMFDENLSDVVTRQRRTIRGGVLRPVRAEMSFGLNPDDSGPLEISTPGGRTVALRGKIDRIDVHPAGSELVTSVIDYKLKAKCMDWKSAYAGLALQLITYLLVLSEKGAALLGQPVSTAGALFVGVSRILRSEDHPDCVPSPDSDVYWKESQFKPRGLINTNHLNILETNFAGESNYFVAAIPKLNIRFDAITHDAMKIVLDWTRSKIGALADEIADGNIAVHPYRIGTAVPCGSCAYRSFCRFDRFVNKYKDIKGGKAEEILQLMKSEVER